MDVGQVVMKVFGREAGKVGVVLKKIDSNFVSITGPKILTGVKRRRANIIHIEPIQYKLEIKENATDEEVIEAFKKSGLANKLNLKFPSAAEIKSVKPKEEKPKEEMPKEKPKEEKVKESPEKVEVKKEVKIKKTPQKAENK